MKGYPTYASSADYLKKVVLNNVTYRTGFLVKTSTANNPKVLSHSDLYRADVVSVPEWLEKRICKTKDEHI